MRTARLTLPPSDSLINGNATQGYFPAGSTGTVTITGLQRDATGTAAGAPSGTLAYVTVTIAWTGGGVSNGSTTVSAIVSKSSHL